MRSSARSLLPEAWIPRMLVATLFHLVRRTRVSQAICYVVVHTVMEIIQEKCFEHLLLLQTWGIVSLEVRRCQMPVIFSQRLMLLLHDGESTKGGKALNNSPRF